MYRPMILSLAVTTLAQFAIPGCPPTAEPDADSGVAARLSIETTAQSDTELAGTGQSVALSATADTARGAVSFSWVQSRGPGVSISDADKAEAGFVAASLAEEKTLTFIVTTRNESGDVGRAETSVIVAADPEFDTGGSSGGGGGSGSGNTGRPTARAGGDRTVDPDTVVTLDGSASSGSGLTYSWAQVSGKPQLTLGLADTVRPFFTAPSFAASANEFRFELAVRDDQQQSSRDSVTVRIREPDSGGSFAPPKAKTRVRFETSRGDFVIELEDVLVPDTVANFLEYVNDGFYEGLIFHRVIPDFVVQGGGFTPLMDPAETRDPIALEIIDTLKNDRGTVGMARLSDPDTATSQFYVNLKDNDDLNASAGVDGFRGFAVFGRVVSGMDVIDGIAGVRTASRGFPPDRFDDVPVVDIIINSAIVE